MRTLLIVAAAALLVQGCASRQVASERPMPEFYQHDYEFAGEFEGRPVRGTLWFSETSQPNTLEYTMSSDVGLCRGEVRHANASWIQLGCGGIRFDFARGGNVVARSDATWQTTRPVTRRECRSWTINERGQRVCTGWANVTVDVPVTYRGRVRLERLDVY